ncbi:MAG: nucleotidyl transferase AbiEii/AbiGii toxin family protein [Acidobacteriaceae bacterium]
MTNHEHGVWHREVTSASTEATLCALRDAQLLDHFYLAGGTGLALQFGHRLSHDLDFFAKDHFNEETFLQRVQALAGFALVAKAPYTLHATVQETKVSFLGYAYPVLFPTNPFLDVAVADPRDIACMKVGAIAGRGTKRDFVDLYTSAERYGLTEILRSFDRKYAQTNYSKIHILKSLTFFGDAEKDPMPHMLVALDWDKVKQFFLREAPRLF